MLWRIYSTILIKLQSILRACPAFNSIKYDVKYLLLSKKAAVTKN